MTHSHTVENKIFEQFLSSSRDRYASRTTRDGTKGLIAEHCRTLQNIAEHCRTLQNITEHCRTLQSIAEHCRTLQNIAKHCRKLQNIADIIREILLQKHCNISLLSLYNARNELNQFLLRMI